jgi:hypothetical protein
MVYNDFINYLSEYDESELIEEEQTMDIEHSQDERKNKMNDFIQFTNKEHNNIED